MDALRRWFGSPKEESKTEFKRIKPTMPKFCRNCGKTLEIHKERVEFDPYTGQPRYEEWWKCPDADPAGRGEVIGLTEDHADYFMDWWMGPFVSRFNSHQACTDV